ncbi:MAG: molecular chaperone Hsp90 [Actinomycetia bacterium]|nr:molecular chaperone Hsp90 [Actinomycetes bacterium]
MSSATADPFGTERLRAAVLDAWRASPTRFREDANVEDDYALGAYRDRLVVELAQNASDAALVGDVGGRLLLRLDDEGLTAANIGAPLDRAGVESLAAMRASSKSVEAVGRFGVGFAAVLAVSDAPEVRSRNGGVRFDRLATADLMREDTTLSSLVDQRVPPVLRIPFATDAAPPDGYDTAVVLPWRDDAARVLAVEAISAIDEVLLLSLRTLNEVIVEIVGHGTTERHTWAAERGTVPWVIRHDEETSWWRVESIEGGLNEAEEESLPHEEALRRRWRASVALPVTEGGLPLPLPGSLARVVHAPTPTDEPCGLPAVAIGDFGLDASRRHIAEGARTDAVVDAIASAYVSLVLKVARDHGSVALTLVPQPALLGPIDHLLREQVRERLARSHWVPRACDGRPERPSELVALEPSDPGVVRVLAEHLVDLADPDWVGDELRGLGLVTRPVAEVWDSLASLGLSPMQWHVIYDEVQRLDPRVWEGLPVPLTDGRVVRGARTTMLAGVHGDELALLGVDVVHDDAEHQLLERLGARSFDVKTVLDDAFVRRVRDAVEFDPVDAREMISAAAQLLVDADVTAGELVALANLPVPTSDGGWAPAASVVVPGSAIDGVAGAEVPRLADAVAETATASAWAALGVLADLTPVTLHELPLDPDSWDDLMVDGADWCASVAERAGTNDPGELLAPDVTIVRGIELVEGLSLTDLVGLLAAPGVMRALVAPTVVLTGDGRRVAVASPGAWWLSEAPLLDGRSPIEVRVPGDDRLAQFFPVVEPPSGVSQELLDAIGVHSTLERWLQAPDGVNELLDAMADDERVISTDLLAQLYTQITATEHPELVDPPSHLRAIVDGAIAVTDADEVIVAIAPHHALVLQTPHIPGTHALADLLDVDVSDDASCAASGIAGSGFERPVPQLPILDASLTTYREHDELHIGDVVVDWWVTDQGEVHAATLEGLARALAWASGHWSRRFELAASLERPESAEGFGVERFYDR